MPGMNEYTGARLTESDHVRQCIRTILLTPIGTRLMRREFGSLIPDLLGYPLNQATLLRLYSVTAAAIMKWEKRVTVKSMRLNIATDGSAVFDVEYVFNGDAFSASAPFSVPLQKTEKNTPKDAVSDGGRILTDGDKALIDSAGSLYTGAP